MSSWLTCSCITCLMTKYRQLESETHELFYSSCQFSTILQGLKMWIFYSNKEFGDCTTHTYLLHFVPHNYTLRICRTRCSMDLRPCLQVSHTKASSMNISNHTNYFMLISHWSDIFCRFVSDRFPIKGRFSSSRFSTPTLNANRLMAWEKLHLSW